MSQDGVFSGLYLFTERYSPYSIWIWKNTDEKELRIWILFTEWRRNVKFLMNDWLKKNIFYLKRVFFVISNFSKQKLYLLKKFMSKRTFYLMFQSVSYMIPGSTRQGTGFVRCKKVVYNEFQNFYQFLKSWVMSILLPIWEITIIMNLWWNHHCRWCLTQNFASPFMVCLRIFKAVDPSSISQIICLLCLYLN